MPEGVRALWPRAAGLSALGHHLEDGALPGNLREHVAGGCWHQVLPPFVTVTPVPPQHLPTSRELG